MRDSKTWSAAPGESDESTCRTAALALRIAEVAQRAAPHLQSPRQHVPNGYSQALCPRFAEATRRDRRANAGSEQGLTRVDVTHPHHQIAGQQHLLDRGTALSQTLVKGGQIELVGQRLNPQATQQLARHGIRFTRGIDHGAEATRIVQTQQAVVGVEIEMIMPPGRCAGGPKRQGARHAQVQQQQALVQVDQQVLAATTNRPHLSPHQHVWLDAKRPAQRLAQAYRQNTCTGDAFGKAQTGNFNLG